MKFSRAGWLAILAPVLALPGCNRSAPPATPPSEAAGQTSPEPTVQGPELRIVALGDSLFAGYGLRPEQSYPVRLEQALRARGINARVTNAGVSGNTTGDGLQRLAFTLDNQPGPPRLVIISLGGNDMLRGLPPAEARDNLDAILGELAKRHIPVVVMGMLAAPNLGQQYAHDFNAIYPEVTNRHHAALVPFFLAPVVNKPDLVQPDHIHPTGAGVDVIVNATIDTVTKALGK
jgi:acyl-CoA thioesterase-1